MLINKPRVVSIEELKDNPVCLKVLLRWQIFQALLLHGNSLSIVASIDKYGRILVTLLIDHIDIYILILNIHLHPIHAFLLLPFLTTILTSAILSLWLSLSKVEFLIICPVCGLFEIRLLRLFRVLLSVRFLVLVSVFGQVLFSILLDNLVRVSVLPITIILVLISGRLLGVILHVCIGLTYSFKDAMLKYLLLILKDALFSLLYVVFLELSALSGTLASLRILNVFILKIQLIFAVDIEQLIVFLIIVGVLLLILNLFALTSSSEVKVLIIYLVCHC